MKILVGVNIIIRCPTNLLKLYWFKELVVIFDRVLAVIVRVCHNGGGYLLGVVLRAYLEGFRQNCHPWWHGWSCFAQSKISWNFCLDILIGSLSRRGSLWRYLVPDKIFEERVFFMSCMIFSTPRQILSKLHVDIFIWSGSGMVGQEGDTERLLRFSDQRL